MEFLGFDLLELGFALLLVIALIALPLASVLTLVFIRQFRRRVEQSMRAAANVTTEEMPPPLPGGLPGELAIEQIDATGRRVEAARAVPLIGETRRHSWELAAIYAGATLVYPLVLAPVIILGTDFAPEQHVLLKFALLFGLFFTENATPVALAPTLVLKKQVRFLALAVLVLIIVLGAWDAMIETNGVGTWLMIASVPTGAILIFNVRRLRAVGPLIFAATLLFLLGVVTGLAYAALYALDAAGPIRFVREDLAQLSFLGAGEIWVGEFLRLPFDQMLDRIRALIDNPSSVVRAEHPEGLTAEVRLYFFGIWLAATALGVAAAWVLLRSVARRYRTKRASDQMLTLDVLMIVFTLSTFLLFLFAFSWIEAAAVLGSFAGYTVFSRWRLQRRERSTRLVTPRTLLLLRVFGFDRRTQRLLEDLGQRWRYLGPIRMIGGPDLAYATLEPYEFFEFLSGRLARAFIKDRDDLDGRLLSESTATPDPDGLFRIEDFFCHDNTWRMTVSRLARKADTVLMDLRGFMSKHQGCIFEIEQLIVSVPLQHIVLLVDRSTDVPFLDQTLQRAWRTMPTDSPNAIAGEHRVRILQASSSHRRTLDALLGLLSESFSERRGAPLPPASKDTN